MPTVNIKAFSHKKSTVVENGGPKLPTAAQLELGEIAINFAKGYETLSIKNNNNEIVTFTNDNYWINKELAIAAALNDLNDRKQDALEMDEIPTEGSENVVTSGGLYSYITEIEQVTAAALNDLNDRITSLALSDDYAAAAQGTPPLAGDTYETAISKLHKVIVDDELITSSALNDLNDRIDNLSLSEDYEAADPTSEPAGGDTYEEAISKLHGAILENELATAGALNDLNTRISDIVVPELILSEDYEPSSLSNEDLFLEPGDSYETAFAKLEKTINDNENITSAALTDLDSRLNLLHLPQSLDDIPDGSTRKLSDYATTILLATKQNTLVSGTNIKTINNESILGSGNITIQGGDTNVIETIKINNVALTPDANKAVNIPITNEKYGNGLAVQTDNGSTQNITASLTDYVLTNNGRVSVILTHDLPYGPTLNINNTGAKNIYDISGLVLTDSGKAYAGDIITVVYDGTNYKLIDVFHATEFSSYIESDPLILTLTDDSEEENIKLCTFARYSDHPVITPFDPFDPLDMIVYNDLIFSNPQRFEVAPGLEMWTFSSVSENPDNEKVALFLRIFHQWDPTYQGGIERTYIDTDYSPDIIEVLNLEGIVTKYAGEIDTHEGRELGNEPKIFRWVAMNYTFDGCTGGLVIEDSYESSSHVVTYRQTLLGYQKIYYRTSSTTDMSNSNWTEAQSGDTNIIESVKVNGTALAPDANKAVNITNIPASIVTQDAAHRFVSDTEKTTWNNKVSNVQADWNATSGLAQILNKPTIPAEVTESTVSGWGFTKNAGTITGITMNGASKGTSGVVDLGTVITSETALSKGTTTGNGNAVTDISVSGHQITLTKGSTFLTSETLLSKGTTTGNGNAVTDISVNGHQITLTKGTTFLTSHQGIKTLKTDNTTAQSTSSSEAIAGSGTINLHKVAKTGTYSDLIGTPTIPAAPGTLNTTATTAQSTSSSEALSGNITLHKVAKTGTYNDLIGKPTIPTVNNATLTIQKNGTTVNTFTANASSNVTANIQVNELPTVSSSDNGKVLMVVNGAWSLVMPTSIYSGTSTPDSNTGNNGDIYLQTS